VIWLESEFWPNTLYAIKQKNIPLILLNGRVSDRSFPRWKNLSSIIGGMLALFDECLAQSDEDARRLSILGARSPVCFGNIKLGAPPLPVDDQSLIEFTQYINDRPLWLLSSSHAGEETIAGEIHTLLSASHKNILSIIVPRHPERGPAIAAEMLARGLTVRLRSENEIPDDKTDIYIADTVGELGLFYRLSDIVVIGKSLLPPGGGQNPYEATQLDNTVLFGPYMSNFSALAINMIAAGVAVQIQQKENLFKELNSLLGDKALLGQRIKSARDFTHGSETVIIDTVAIIRKYL
jgi:3-deoxy-D-manno-octulosonic-acid transferase